MSFIAHHHHWITLANGRRGCAGCGAPEAAGLVVSYDVPEQSQPQAGKPLHTMCCGTLLTFTANGQAVTCQSCGANYICTGVPDEPAELTVADLRAYFERRAGECNGVMTTLLDRLGEPGLPSRESSQLSRRHIVLDAQRGLYEELIDIIDRGELPD